LIGILVVGALLRLWRLDQNGYSREYFAAGVRSMLGSLHCFLFNAFDPAGFVSLDKPPVAMWLQVASAKALGFSAFSVLLPQVLEGLISVALVYRLVARRFDAGAALAAALFLALTPICVAIDRSNNTDSCLIMVLLLATWALLRAAELGSRRLLLLAMAGIGVAFNVKMAAALVVVPTFVLAYFLAASGISTKRRLLDLGLSLVVMAIVSLSWVSFFDLTPAAERPYAGSTRHNSMLELAVLHNGLERFIAPPSGTAAPRAPDAASATASAAARARRVAAAGLWDQTPIGPLRLATPHLAAQMAWWLPLALAGIVLGLAPWRPPRRLSPAQTTALVWTGWAATYAVVFSFAGGVFHTYYVAILGPPLAALAGIGSSLLVQRYRQGTGRRGLPLLLLAAAAWQVYIDVDYAAWPHDDWRSVLLLGSVCVLLLASVALVLASPRRRLVERSVPALAALALVALLVTPAAWALSTVLIRPNVAAPAADIAVFADHDGSGEAPSARPRRSASRLLEFLAAERHGERFLLAVPNAMQASPIIVRTGASVMAMGGYLGSDPILAPADLERMVNRGELRFVVLGGVAIVPPDSVRERALAAWVRAHGQRVEAALWREPADAASAPAKRWPWPSSPARLYDLRPDRAEPEAGSGER
jgi:4-amino-4-deoxy-L-arabinose transferase-like glycosyltransferase